ncbi:hypothetical protein [Streptomyces sp. Ac-502]|uniref:hypothetical protein n=1 Tax=Streptomyces sp. Ac-502 TaxID=3342801 RepID=UPI003862B711
MRERTGRRITALLTAVAATVLLGPGAAAPYGNGGRPSFTLRSHEPFVLPADDPEAGRVDARAAVPRLTPAFENTGDVPAARGVVLAVKVGNAVFDVVGAAAGHDNCYYPVGGRSVFCEFPDAVPVGAAYETAEPLPAVTSDHATVEGAYRYAVWPLGDPPPYAEDYKSSGRRGSGPALGLVPVAGDTVEGGGELRFASPSYSKKADWKVKGVTLRGRVGEYATAEMANIGDGAGGVRVELPPGTSFAPLTSEEREGTPSEISTCWQDDLDGHIQCGGQPNYEDLRVRIDRRVDGAEGKVSVREPIEGDTDPTNNTAPIRLEITDTAPPGKAAPPVPAEPGTSPAPATARDAGRPRKAELAVAAAAAALALATVLFTRRKRARRAGGPA